ncbi:MAG: MMPL family transporter [Planctomycetota bacterium]
MISKLAEKMVTYRAPMFFGCLILAACLYPLSQNVRYDRSIHSFFDEDHERLVTYSKVEKEFGGDTMCFVVYSDARLLTPEGMEQLRAFAAKLRAVPGVLLAASLADLRRPTNATSSKTLAEWFKEASPEEQETLCREVLNCEIYANQFIGSDGQTTSVVLLVDPAAMQSGEIRETIRGIRQIANVNPSPARVVGSPILINDVFDNMEQDSEVLTTVSTGAMLLVILFLFRNLRWAILPFLIVQVTLIWVRSIMVLNDIQLGFTGAMSTSLITVIGIATTIHVAVRYREEFDQATDAEEAMRQTLERAIAPIFWTCATTAVGFGSLAVSKVAPVRDFGWIMSAASMLVGVASFLLIPGGVLLGRFASRPNTTLGEARLADGLGWLEVLTARHAVLAATLTLLLLSVSSVGMLWLEVETDFTKNFRNDSPVLEGYRFVEDRLAGAGLLGVSFDAPKRLTPEFLDTVRKCESRLRELDGVSKVTGLTDFLDFVAQSMPAAAGRSSVVLNLQLNALQRTQPKEIEQVWNGDKSRMRIVLRVQESQASSAKAELLATIESIGREYFGESVHATGLYVLLVHLIDSLLSDQWLSFFTSAAGALVMMVVAFRSLRLGLVAFAPNLIPIAVVAGSMGWLGLRINAATAMINSITMGLVIDFSIHYLSRFQLERKKTGDFHEALLRTHRSTGRSMVFASLALMLGFSVLAFSNFLPTMQFGLLVSLAMLGGLVGNLVMMPVLLRLAYWKGRPAEAVLATTSSPNPP